MKNMILAAAMAAVSIPALPAAAQRSTQERQAVQQIRAECRADRRRSMSQRERKRIQRQCQREIARTKRDYRQYRNYDYNRYEPGQTTYNADSYYRDGRYYQDRRLSSNDRVYRGQNGQYYCRRPDGTTGLIIGGIGGGVLGNIIAPGGSNTLGTIIGAVAGGLGGRAIDRNNVRCN